jgi:AraC family transcriptional regulator
MNAPCDPALLQPVPPGAGAEPVEVWRIRPESIRLSSRSLGWGPVNIERREVEPASDFLPGGTTEHLIFVNLSDQHVVCESDGEIIEGEYAAGHVGVHPSRTPVRWEWETRLNFLLMTLEPAFLDRVARDSFGQDDATVELAYSEGKHDPVISNIASALLREALSGDVGNRMLAESLASVLAVHLIRHYAGRPPRAPVEGSVMPTRAVSQAVRFIHANYARELSLADIGEAARLSSFHLTRVFKKAMGMSPHQYLVQVRVNTARALLTSGAGRQSLAEVAAAVGFSDQSHLTRQFKRVLGLTPKQVRL